MLAAAPSLARG